MHLRLECSQIWPLLLLPTPNLELFVESFGDMLLINIFMFCKSICSYCTTKPLNNSHHLPAVKQSSYGSYSQSVVTIQKVSRKLFAEKKWNIWKGFFFFSLPSGRTDTAFSSKSIIYLVLVVKYYYYSWFLEVSILDW